MRLSSKFAVLVPTLCFAASSYAAPAATKQLALTNTPAITRDGEEHLAGKEAVAHLQKLQKSRKQLDKAADRLRELGFTPTDNVSVIRSDETVRGRSSRGKSASRVQQTFSNANGELVFWEWDDGSDGTWGGVIYVENYSTGATATWNTQLDVSSETSENFTVIWEDFVGGTAPGEGYQQTAIPDERQSAPQIASISPAAAWPAVQDSAEVMLVQSRGSVSAYLACVAQFCGYPRVLLCTFMGPHCVAARCGTGAIRCALLYL